MFEAASTIRRKSLNECVCVPQGPQRRSGSALSSPNTAFPEELQTATADMSKI